MKNNVDDCSGPFIDIPTSGPGGNAVNVVVEDAAGILAEFTVP